MSFTPRSLPQAAMLSNKADILLFGGAAGSLKTHTMLVDAAQSIGNGNHHAILFRRTFPELEASLILQSREMYYDWGGVYNESKKQWKFPSGAKIAFGHCQRDAEIYDYMGAEFSYIGFDESTHLNEFPVRYMLSRLRSKDPTLPLKMRLATNPGNIGHQWHMHMFMGPTCLHCAPSPESKETFKIYKNATWMSDKEPVGLTTCFIPGRVDDHNIFGEGGTVYKEKLKSLPPQYRAALMNGCWAMFEGQYFRCWDMPRMVVPANCLYRVNEQGEYFNHWEVDKGKPVTPAYWWPHWVSVDWGFSHNSVAYLFTKAPNGITYAIGEYVTSRTKPGDLANTLRHMWYRDNQDSPMIVASYLSPDAYAKRTDESSIADQMAEHANIYFTPASNDRLGGAMVIYSMLDNDTLKMTSSCPTLVSTLPSRVHDDRSEGKHMEDVKKTSDVYDDCFVAGTLITTNKGQVPIEQLNVGDKVLTRAGFKSITRTIKRPACDILEVTGNINLTGTGNHKIWTTLGWKSLKNIHQQDVLKLSTTEEAAGDDTQTVNNNHTNDTSGVVIKKDEKDFYTGKYGWMQTIKQFLQNITSIMKMKISTITTLATWFHYLLRCTYLITCAKVWKGQARIIGCINTLMQSALLLKNGMPPKLVLNGTNNMQQILNLDNTKEQISSAWSAKKLLQLQRGANFAAMHVSLHTDVPKVSTMLKRFAVNVAQLFNPTNMKKQELVHVDVQLKDVGECEVYDITVEDVHEFFANGLLVQNCYDSFRYGIYSHMGEAVKPRDVRIREAMTASDPTQAMIQRAIMEARFAKDDQPVSYNNRDWRGGHA